jgi:hypothetical protein
MPTSPLALRDRHVFHKFNSGSQCFASQSRSYFSIADGTGG